MVHVVQAEGRDVRARYRLIVREPLPFDCVDGLGTPERVGVELNLGGAAVEGDWDADGTPNQTNGLCLHENQLWAVHVDTDQPGGPGTRMLNGPYVQRWNGVAWQDMGFPALDPLLRPARPAIVSDGAGTVFVAFSQVYSDCDIPSGCRCPPCGHITNSRNLYGWQTRFVQVWAYDGAWTLSAQYPLGPTLGLSGDFKHKLSGCDLSFYENAFYTAQNETLGDCGGPTFGTGSMGRIYLGAQSGSHVVVWTENGKILTVVSSTTGCVADQCTELTSEFSNVDYAGVFSGNDGAITQLSSDGGDGITDLIWDATSAAPLLSWTQADVADARDGSVIQNIADSVAGQGVLFSNDYAGTRYLLGDQNPLGPYVWETSADCTVAAGPLDGADLYANGVEPMPSLGVRPLAEAQNIWQVGAIGRGCNGTGDSPCNGGPFLDDEVLASAVFTRRCVDNCPPEAWVAIGVDPGGRVQEPTSNYIQILTSTSIYAIVRTSDLTDTFPSEHRVYRVPILRCTAPCPGPPVIQAQSFTTGQHFDEGSGTQNWGVVLTGFFDRVKFYVDGVLVYTHEPVGVGPAYYGGAAPGAYDVGALAVGDHTMEVVAELDECGPGGPPYSDSNSATITIDAVGAVTYQHVTYRVDGVDYGPYAVTIDGFGGIQIGGISGSQGIYNHLIRNVKVGTSGYGSTELFSAALTSGSIVPPFDSTTGGGDLSITGGGLLVQNADGADAYAEKALATGGDVYISLEVSFDTDETTGPDGLSIPIVVLDGSSVWVDSVAADFRSGAGTHLKFLADNGAGGMDGPITDATYYTLDIFYSTT